MSYDIKPQHVVQFQRGHQLSDFARHLVIAQRGKPQHMGDKRQGLVTFHPHLAHIKLYRD